MQTRRNVKMAFWIVGNLVGKYEALGTLGVSSPFSILLQGFHSDTEAERHRYIHHCNNIPNRVPPNMYYSIE